MAKIIITTNDGLKVAEYELDEHGAMMFQFGHKPAGHVGVNRVLSGMSRSLVDAGKIERGEDPRRPSEIAMERAEGLQISTGPHADEQHEVQVVELEEGEHDAERRVADNPLFQRAEQDLADSD